MTLGQGNLLNNRYRVVEILGRGGMGAVYRAVDESLGVDVAVKENLFTTDDYARQFRMEAVILAGIRHPNLPRVTDHFVLDGMGQYLVMDYIDGYDLRQHMEKGGPISEEEAVRVGAAACDALAYLHSRKPPILHRDIKLGNIKIATEGQVYLVDFGLAKMGWEHEETMTGARAMTPGYSPPEQYGSARTDSRSDIYSLGATLYAALTGIIPEDSLMRAIDGVNLTPLREHRPEISPRLAAVIEKALETSSANRYQSADAFKRALLGQSEPQLQTEKTGAMQSQPVATPTRKTAKRKSSFWPLLGLSIMLLLIGGGVVWFTPLSQKLSQAGFLPLPLSLSPQTPLPTDPSTVLVAKTSLPALTPTLITIPAASPTTTSTLTRATATQPTITPGLTMTTSELATQTLAPTASLPQATVAVQTTPAGDRLGEIAFASMVDKVAQIFTINADGTDQRQLTNIPLGACSFDWSPDGKQIVYISPCLEKASQYPDSALYVLDVASGKTRSLAFKPSGDFEPVWSPDGNKIAFTSLRDGSMQIYVFDLSDASLTRLTAPGGNAQARYPAWSPDSRRIAFTVLRLGLLQIWDMAADGSNKQQLVRTGGSSSEYLPTWSPDGTSLLFSQTNSNLTAPASLVSYIFETGKYNLLPIPRPVVDVNFSPDGHWIAYETTDTKNQDIYICQLPEGSPQRLTISPETDFDPAWRPGN
jgi:serine/threonine protein kinase/Tol biopolymer transport system component